MSNFRPVGSGLRDQPKFGEILALIEVKTANGIEYYSAGSSEFGLLGQGTNDKSDKIKTKV